jgi:signal transduction histidine kinase
MHVHDTSDEVSRHKCLIYDGHPSEQLPVVVPLLMDGIQDHWRCLYLGAPDAVQMVDTALSARGVDTSMEGRRGALVLSSDRSHLVGGHFEPRAMIDGLTGAIDDAVRDGYGGLCATGDMRWELGADDNFDRLLEYEAQLEQVFREKPLRGICQYHRDILPAQAIRDALVVHRTAYIGEVLNRDNLFYIPPELLLEAGEGKSESKQGEWMCQQIIRVLKAERIRDQALNDLRKSEAEQRRLAEELAELNRGLERRVSERTAELEVSNRELEAFSYSVSHDLRAPLRSISGFGGALANSCGDRLGDDERRFLRIVLDSAREMGELIDGMLELARIAKSELARTPIDMSELSDEVVRAIPEDDRKRSAEFVIHRGLSAVGDPVLLRAVMTNLIGNAWKFSARRERARIEVGALGDELDMAVFFVKDNGAGFDMQYASKLFAVFQRLHSVREFPGNGVGLATVARIVAKHCGRIWAEGTPGVGATFYFTLPKLTTRR